MSSFSYKEYRQARFYNAVMRPVYVDYARKFNGHFLTLTSRTCLPVTDFHSRVREFHKRLDQTLLGRNFYKKPPEGRTQGVMFLEQITSHIHGHALVCFAGDQSDQNLQQICSRIWSELCPGGSALVQPQGLRSPAEYASKEFETLEHDDLKQVILFSDFASK